MEMIDGPGPGLNLFEFRLKLEPNILMCIWSWNLIKRSIFCASCSTLIPNYFWGKIWYNFTKFAWYLGENIILKIRGVVKIYFLCQIYTLALIQLILRARRDYMGWLVWSKLTGDWSTALGVFIKCWKLSNSFMSWNWI